VTNRDAAPKAIGDVIPLLIDVKQNLDGDISLHSMARKFGASPFQFHRWFSTVVGETPRQHVARLRLERAAYKLAITEDSILDVGLSVGFKAHETFSRAFRRCFDCSPSHYRRTIKAALRERMERNRAFRGDGCELSQVRFETLPSMPLLAIRRLGAYSGFDPTSRESLWSELIGWAEQNGVAYTAVRMGLFPDDPNLTPKAMQQADLCIPIQSPAAGTDRIRCIALAGGTYGVIDHFGPYSTVDQAYRTVADGIRRSGRYVLREDPPVQMFLAVAVGGDPAANHSQVCFPVRRKT
jgi:AraC family transcriptional regulator